MKSLIKLGILIALLAGAVYFLRFTETGRQITPSTVKERIESHGPLAARAIYVCLYIVGTVLLFPGTALSFAGAVLFGAVQGTLFTWMGATIGSVLAFLLARALGRDFVDQLMGGKFDAFERRISKHGFTGLLIIRLLPIFPFNGVNFASGLTSIRLRDYTLATAIGIVPGTFVYQYLFATFGDRILNEGLKWEYFRDPNLLSALGLFVIFLVVGKKLAARFQSKEDAVPSASDADSSSTVFAAKD